jgi:diguanylate cyclase (GGDEF)-like protein
MYADLNQFKAYNDHYGFMAGDEVLKGLASVIVGVVEELDATEAFVGHVGGDDFVVIAPIARAEELARAVCERFDAVAPGFYDAEDLAVGHIEVVDRQGRVVRVGPVSVSIGIAHNAERPGPTRASRSPWPPR